MKNKFIKLFPYLLVSFIILYVYKNWFLVTDIIGGDWPYYFPQVLSDFTFPPLSWANGRGNGFGGIDVTYALHTFEHFTVLASAIFGVPWYIISKIIWFGLFLLLMGLAMAYLHKVIFPKGDNWQKAIAVLIYGVNTYILLIASGGQMGYGLGYAVAPLVVALFFKGFSLTQGEQIIKNTILTSLMLGFLLMIDIRVAYLTLIIVGFYSLYSILFTKVSVVRTGVIFLLPVLVSGLLNLAWILPLVFFKQNIVSEVSTTYNSLESLRFFSFADFPHTLGFLHPNWPENIFGKVTFMNPQFLLLSLLAFASLLFIKNTKEKKYILFFALLGLLGAFLAKGTNEPFGYIYSWLFEYIPGFVMFRDPTKFYTLIALSYALLISYSVAKLKDKFPPKQVVPIYIIVIFVYLFMLPQALFGQLGGTFQKHFLPQEYKSLTTYLDKQPEFFRTIWFPRQTRFAYSSTNHRPVEALPFYNATSSAELINHIQKPNAQQKLAESGIKYLVVPSDTFGEIFQEDRKYNHKEYLSVVNGLREISWLTEVPGFDNIIVFENPSYKDHFYVLRDGKLTYKTKNSTEHMVKIVSEEKNTLIFIENYNPSWRAEINGQTVSPTKTKIGYMQFVLPEKGTYNITITFSQQKYYLTGFILSSAILLLLIVTFVVLQYKNFFVYLKNTF